MDPQISPIYVRHIQFSAFLYKTYLFLQSLLRGKEAQPFLYGTKLDPFYLSVAYYLPV